MCVSVCKMKLAQNEQNENVVWNTSSVVITETVHFVFYYVW